MPKTEEFRTDISCPFCDSLALEFGKRQIRGKEFYANIFFVSCNALNGDDPNWGGGDLCPFFIVRESLEILYDEIEKIRRHG